MTKADVKLLVEDGYFDYGFEADIDEFAEICGIRKPNLHRLDPNSIINTVRKYDLAILGAYDVVNKYLIDNGKKIYKDKDSYKVAGVSETLNFVSKYQKEGSAKFNKAQRLLKSFSIIHPTTTEVDVRSKKIHIQESNANRFNRAREL